MKDTGRCPKCQSTDLARVPGVEVSLSGSRSNIIRVGWWRGAVVTRFVCCGCGFSEEWIEHAEALQKIKSKYGSQHAEPGATADGGA